MKILQCACILGAVAALYSVAQRAMVREPSLASGETLALAALDNAHANLERDFAALAFTAADPIPVASLGARSLRHSSSRESSSRNTVVASADPNPVIAARVIPVSAVSSSSESLSSKILAFDDPKPNAYFDPTPIGPANPIVVASLGLVPISQADVVSQADLAPAEPPKHDFRYLAYYAYSETPPPEKPADTVLNSLQDIPVGTPIEEIRHAADAFGLDFGYMKAVAKIESDFDPKQRTGSYVGLYQLSKYEFNRYGDGDILSPRDNAIAAAYKIIVEAELFELRTHKHPTLSDLYLIHQQGIQGAEEHVSHPDRVAWQSMCATEEGQQRGEKWCKRAIWQNTLPEIKKIWKSVDNLTSAAFVGMWEQRVADLYARYSKTADAAPAK
ncbi:MAG TPA: transglycosylase [Xanthobacteraceae bacterium]|nr:transglycosylase [Xanthobacteraceae bacterium]